MTSDELLTCSEELLLRMWLDRSISVFVEKRQIDFACRAPCFDQVHEHVRATRLLLRHRLNGSAFSLMRVIFETFYRGLWLRHCATDQELADFQKDEPPRTRNEIIQAIEAKEPL